MLKESLARGTLFNSIDSGLSFFQGFYSPEKLSFRIFYFKFACYRRNLFLLFILKIKGIRLKAAVWKFRLSLQVWHPLTHH
jgi:hypothetical protein